MKLAAHQPQYMPWLGYFDKMRRVDLFVLLDTVQYKKNKWQNRNRIRSAGGWQWITVPVRHRFPMRIDEIRIDDTTGWRRKHEESIRQAYARAPYAETATPLIGRLLAQPIGDLASLNALGVRMLTEALQVFTPIVVASSLAGIPDGPDARLIALCRRFGCDTYLAGQGGREYMDLALWRQAGIAVEFQEFRHPVYPQCHPGFEPCLSAVDALMQCGPRAAGLLRSMLQAAA